MIVYGACLIRRLTVPPSPCIKDMQTFYENGGEGLKALRIKDL